MIWFVVLFLLGMGVQFWPTLVSRFDQVPGDLVDGRMNNLVLENAHLFFTGKITLESHFSPPYFFPMKEIIGWTDTLWGTTLVYSFFRGIGLDIAHGFTAWLMVCSALNFGVTFYVLKKHFSLQSLGSAVGAFLFAFSCARTAQIGHPQLFPAFATPLYFGWLYLSLKDLPKLNLHALALAAAALVFQIYAGFYLGWFLALTTTIGLIPFLASKETRRNAWTCIRQNYLAIAAIGFCSALALIPQMIPFLKAARVFGPRPYSSVRVTYPQWSSFFNMGPEHWLEGWLGHMTGADQLLFPSEHKLGVGLVSAICILLALRMRVARKSLPALLGRRMFSWTLLFSFGIGFGSLWALVYLFFPGGSAIRAVGRIILVLLFFAAVPLGVWAQSLARRWQVAVIAIIVLEAITTPLTHSTSAALARIQMIDQMVPHSCDVFYVYGASPGFPSERLQIDAMWIARTRGIKTVNGYSGHEPPNWNLSPGSLDLLKKWQLLHSLKLKPECVIHHSFST